MILRSALAGLMLGLSTAAILAQGMPFPGPGGVAAPPTCASVTSLAAWFAPANIVGGPNVTAWNDSSGNSRNMTCTNNPQQFTMLNSLSGVQFDGVNRKCQSSAFTLAQPFTIYAIVNFTVIGSGVRALESTTGTGTPNWVERSTTVGWNSAGGDGLAISPTANTNYFIHAVCNGVSSSLMALNSNSDTTGSCGDTASMSAINIGGGNSGDFSNVAFGELCVYSKAIASGSDDDTRIRTYFTTKWTKP